MTPLLKYSRVATVSALLLLPLVGASSAPPRKAGFVLFSVEKSDRFQALDPVARIDPGGAILPPFPPKSDRERQRFVRRWLSPGLTYRVLFGGVPAGDATIRTRPEDTEISLQAPATIRTAVPLRGKTMALAVSGKGAVWGRLLQRRSLTGAEQAAVLRAAQSVFRKQGVSDTAAKAAIIVTSASLNLDRAGRPEIVARLQATEKTGPRCDLFLIAEPRGTSDFAVTLSAAHNNDGTAEDLHYVEQDLVDALDLDADGIAEVVTRSVYYESHDYTIYQKRRGGTWRGVYRGAGGGV